MTEFLQRLKQRKLVQWAIAYVAFAFALLQALDIVAQRFGWPDQLERILILALAVGFFVTIVLAWYHGERGAQRVSGTEIVILALLLAIGGGLLWRFERTVAPGSRGTSDQAATIIAAKSVAVLPFVNMSGDPKNDYFSDGITEEILDALAQIPDLKVAARTSAFAFKGKAEDLRKVGEVLDVATVLEGSVQQSGDEVRITAQLIDARSGYHLWSEKYDRKLTSIFAVEDEISKAIADKLQVQLAGGNGQSLVGQKTIDPRAHELYLRGMTLLAARGPGLRDAAAAFQQAVTLDPGYAQAWAGLAQAEALVANWHLDDRAAAQARALVAAQRALELDPSVAVAHVARGIVYDDQWRWAGADRELRSALALAPGDAEVIDQHAQFLLATGQLDSALHEIERANRLDPLSGIIGSVHAQILLDLHRCDEASAQITKALAVAPDLLHTNGEAVSIAVDCKYYAQAEIAARRLALLADRDPKLLMALVRGAADPATRAEAVRLAKTVPPQSLNWGAEKAYWLVSLGDREGALTTLENYFANGPKGGEERLWYPAFDPVRNDPRFKAVLKKMGLPYTAKNLDSP